MRISALISVFSISSAQSKSAIFAIVLVLGIPGLTTSLSMIMPWISWVSRRLLPVFLDKLDVINVCYGFCLRVSQRFAELRLC